MTWRWLAVQNTYIRGKCEHIHVPKDIPTKHTLKLLFGLASRKYLNPLHLTVVLETANRSRRLMKESDACGAKRDCQSFSLLAWIQRMLQQRGGQRSETKGGKKRWRKWKRLESTWSVSQGRKRRVPGAAAKTQSELLDLCTHTSRTCCSCWP